MPSRRLIFGVGELYSFGGEDWKEWKEGLRKDRTEKIMMSACDGNKTVWEWIMHRHKPNQQMSGKKDTNRVFLSKHLRFTGESVTFPGWIRWTQGSPVTRMSAGEVCANHRHVPRLAFVPKVAHHVRIKCPLADSDIRKWKGRPWR